MRVRLLFVFFATTVACGSSEQSPAGGGTDGSGGANVGGGGGAGVVCGNMQIESGETCDDGNDAGGDGCSAVCQTEGCDDPLCKGVPDGFAFCADSTAVRCDADNSGCIKQTTEECIAPEVCASESGESGCAACDGCLELGDADCASDLECSTGVCWKFNDYDILCFGSVCSAECASTQDCEDLFTAAGSPQPSSTFCGSDNRCWPVGTGFGVFICS